MQADIEVKVADKLYHIREIGSGQFEIIVNGKALGFYWPEYPEAFLAAFRRMLRDIDVELGGIIRGIGD